MGILRVNNSFNFEKKIGGFCKAPQHKIEQLQDGFAFLIIQKEDAQYPVMIRDIGDMVQFSIAIDMVITSDMEIPHSLSTVLLKLNGESLTGFWGLEEGEDENKETSAMYLYNHNIPKYLLNKSLFDQTIEDLISNYELFYELLDEIEQQFDDVEEEWEDLDEDSCENHGNHRHEH